MTLLRTLIYITSFLVIFTSTALSQNDEQPLIKKDSIVKNTNYYGLRVGLDLSKPIRTLIDNNYRGFGVVGDFRIKKDYYLAAALGNETRTTILPNIENTSSGSYIKAGLNYNAYTNATGMNNLIYVGLYGGFSNFSQELDNYTIYTTTDIFDDDLRTESVNYKGLNATWVELKIGIEVELIHNLYLGINAQLKRSISVKKPEGYANLFIPGFGKVIEDNAIGAGYGYTITYLIPFSKN